MLERLRRALAARQARLRELLDITDRDLTTEERGEFDVLAGDSPEGITALRAQLNTAERADRADVEARAADQTAEQAREQADADQRAAADRTAADTRDANAARTRREHGQTGDNAGRAVGGGVVTREERTYTAVKSRTGAASFFVDAYAFRSGADLSAVARLTRHAEEVRVEGEAQERAVATSGFGGLIVPQYLVDLAALIIRNGRPTANLVQSLPLPPQGVSFDIPRGTTGAAAASQATENTSLQSTDQVWADLIIPVRTIGGQQDVSRQSLERGTPGIDQLIYNDLAAAYMAQLDTQVINGSGASGQLLGMLGTAGISAATAFGAAPSAANFQSKIAGQVAAVAGAGYGVQPRFEIMHPRRWGWAMSLVDTANRPLMTATSQGPWNASTVNTDPGAYGGDNPAGYTIVGIGPGGLPVITDANVPVNIGTNVEDVVLVLDPSKSLLWEDGDGMPRQLKFEQTLGNQLSVKLIAYGYVAFTAGRYPQSIGKVGGLDTVATQGLVAPTF